MSVTTPTRNNGHGPHAGGAGPQAAASSTNASMAPHTFHSGSMQQTATNLVAFGPFYTVTFVSPVFPHPVSVGFVPILGHGFPPGAQFAPQSMQAGYMVPQPVAMVSPPPHPPVSFERIREASTSFSFGIKSKIAHTARYT